jgi:ParB-like chromosome segregation protein Spo0J
MAFQDVAKRIDMFMVPVGLIDVDPAFNPRDMAAPDTIDWIDDLAAQIEARGFDTDRPLLGRYENDRFIITDGHCRWAAVSKLLEKGIEILSLPARLEAKGTGAADRTLLALRTPGRTLTRLEYVTGIKRLLSYGWDESNIALKLGKSRQWVMDCLTLAEAPEELKAAVTNGEITGTEAIKITRRSADPVATLAIARATAKARGSSEIKPRDIGGESKPLNPAQKAILKFLEVWDANGDYEKTIELLRIQVP